MNVNPRKLTAEDLIAYRGATILHNRMVGYPNENHFLGKYNEWTEEEIRDFFRILCEEIHRINSDKYKNLTVRGYWVRRRLCIFYGDLFFKGGRYEKIERIIWNMAQEYKG